MAVAHAVRYAMGRALRVATRFAALGALSGVLAGCASFVFLELLDGVTTLRLDHDWLVWLLPVGGLAIGVVYGRVGGRASGGTALAVREAHTYTDGAPARMAPLVLGGTLVAHLVGASVGREGTAVQMSASLTEAAGRRAALDLQDRAVLARAALAGGFGSVFGVPLAGIVFALEVSRRPRRSPRAARTSWPGAHTWRTLAAAVPAALVGHAVVQVLGHHHHERPRVTIPFDASNVVGLMVTALAFGAAALVFSASVPAVRRTATRFVPLSPLRPMLGGAATLALALIVGRDHLGLSTALLDRAFVGDVDWTDPALKLLLTVVALGSGFVGGEVTPLFVVGATLGAVLAEPLGLPPSALAAMGLVAVFGAAAHVPLACAVMAAELFGVSALVPALAVCVLARAVVRGDGIYLHPPAVDTPAPPASGGPARRGL